MDHINKQQNQVIAEKDKLKLQIDAKTVTRHAAERTITEKSSKKKAALNHQKLSKVSDPSLRHYKNS